MENKGIPPVRSAVNQQDELAIEYVALDRLIPYARNARTHDEVQISQIAASIKEFGWTNPILTDGDKGVIAGHCRLLAARKLGIDTVPCIELSGLSESQKRAYVIADNKLALNAEFDLEMLSLEIEELQCDGFDISLLGFGEQELNDMSGTPTLPPSDFKEVDENIDTEHECPKCGYRYSGGK